MGGSLNSKGGSTYVEGVHFFCLKGVHWGKGGSDFYPQGVHIFEIVSMSASNAKDPDTHFGIWILSFENCDPMIAVYPELVGGGDLYRACKWEKNVVSSRKYVLRKAEKDV